MEMELTGLILRVRGEERKLTLQCEAASSLRIFRKRQISVV